MSTSAAIASSSAVIASSSAAIASSAAAIAAEEARQAKIARCQAFMPRFDHKTATVEDRRDYAQCVGIVHPEPVHPEPWSDGSIYIAKALFVIALIGMGLGVFQAQRECRGDVAGWVLLGLAGFIGAPLAVCGVVGILAGIVWLFK